MDPRKQECFGRYLYGAGYFARDENTLGLLSGGETPPHFCLSCPKRGACEDGHEKRVRQLRPDRAEAFDKRMREAHRRSVPATLAAMYLGSKGLDPYMDEAIENFKRGHADRGAVDGPLVGGDSR